MRLIRRTGARQLGLIGLMTTLFVIGLSSAPAAAATTSFGARLTNQSQPSNAEGGQRCDAYANIPDGSKCTWLSTQAYANGPTGNRAIAPRNGRINRLKLVTCVAGNFQLQFATIKPGTHKAKVHHNGPVIKYLADPFVADGNPDTFCGGDDGIYTVQSFHFPSVAVSKGDYIAIKTKRAGTLYCSGGSGISLYAPPITTTAYSARRSSASCNLLVEVYYAA